MEKSAKEKRQSLVGALVGRSSSPTNRGSPKNSPKVGPAKPATLTIDMESPPLVFYGPPEQSSGALLSGQIVLNVTDPEVHLSAFEMDLNAISSTRKPVVEKCPDCTLKENSLHKWRFLTAPDSKFTKGSHKFPFSFLLPGHLPTTVHNILGNIEYLLAATARTTFAETLTVTRPLKVQRALMPSVDKNSIRVFPPTTLTAYVQTPSVIHPIGQFPLQMRMTGIAVRSKYEPSATRWRLRKLNWRLEETTKNISAACAKHAPKIGGQGKGIFHEEVRELGAGELKSGWKTDFDSENGNIEVEFPFSFNKSPPPNPTSTSHKDSHHFPPACDFDSPTGFAASHSLCLELVIAEERVVNRADHSYLAHQYHASKSAIPTGSARVLRMQFKIIVTERAGMGISWDEEMPPMYEDVPISPPGYAKIDDYDGDDLGTLEPLDGVDGVDGIEARRSGGGSRTRERASPRPSSSFSSSSSPVASTAAQQSSSTGQQRQ